MTVRVRFFANFRDLFGAKDRELAVPDSATVRDILEMLCDTDERREQVYDGRLKPDVVIMKNGASIQSLAGLATPLAPQDTLAIFPLLGGG